MGSFYGSCFASRQTIATGDRCRIVAVVQSTTLSPVEINVGGKTFTEYGPTDHRSHPSAFWTPMTGFLSASYDDFGNVVMDFTGQSRREAVQFIRKLLSDDLEIKQGSSPEHDPGFHLRTFMQENTPALLAAIKTATADDVTDQELAKCWDYIWSVAQRGRLFAIHRDQPRALQFALMHEAAYQALLDRVAAENSYQPMDIPSYVRRAINAGHQGVKRIEEVYQDRDPSRLTESTRAFVFNDGVVCEVLSVNQIRNTAIEGLLIELDEALFSGKLTESQFIEQVTPAIQDVYVMMGLRRMNLRYAPMDYAGQDAKNALGLEYAAFVDKVSQAAFRGRMVHMYGPYVRYAFQSYDCTAVDELVREAHHYDSHMVLESMTPAEPKSFWESPRWDVVLSATMKRKDFVSVLKDQGDKVRVDTLKVLKA